MRKRIVETLRALRGWLGVELDPVSGREKWVSMAGGFVSIALLMLFCRETLHLQGAAMLIASMGASAVLLFGVPHGSLSQPWPVIAGHVLSASVGVLCAKNIPDVALAGACAVGVSLGLMHVFRCIHPPGGATALTAVIGGASVRELGFAYIWCPVLINAVTLVLVAVAFNAFFRWRRYPTYWNRRAAAPAEAEISHEEVVAALREMDSFVDVTEEDLVRLVRILSGKKKR